MARSRGKRITGIILFLIAAAALAAFLFILFADAENIDSIPGTGETGFVALIISIALGVIALLLLLTLVIRRWDRQEEEAEEAEVFFVPEEYRAPEDDEAHSVPVQPMGGGVVPYDLRSVPVRLRSWTRAEQYQGQRVFPYHYPRHARRAVYANDYITVDDEGTRIKLSTLIAAPPGAFRGSFEERPAQRPWSPAKDGHVAAVEREEAVPEAEKISTEEFVAPVATDNGNGQVQETTLYYDYTGDVHDVIDVEGIGPIYADKLNELGVKSTARLCYEDPEELASRLDVTPDLLRSWQAMAELMKVSGIGKQYAEVLVRAGVEGIAELKRRSASRIADQVNEYVDTLETNVLGTRITARRVEGWQEAAKPMRKVRQAVPDQ